MEVQNERARSEDQGGEAFGALDRLRAELERRQAKPKSNKAEPLDTVDQGEALGL